MRILFAISILCLSSAANAETYNNSMRGGSYTFTSEQTAPGQYRETLAGRNGPFIKVDCNGGQRYGRDADIKLVSGESVKLKDGEGNFHIVSCL